MSNPKLKLSYEKVCIEHVDPKKGYCYIHIHIHDGDDSVQRKTYITINGNMTEEQSESEYPLYLCSDEEIDEFAAKLKQILKSNE